MDECRGRERGQHKVGGVRLTESPGMGRKAAGQERQTLRAQVNAEEQQEWTRDLGRGWGGGGQGWSKVMHELTSSSHKSKNQEWIHDGRSVEVEWLVESLYSSQGEGEGEREGGESRFLPGKYTCRFPFPQPCISSAVFGRLWSRDPPVIRKRAL